MIETESCDDVTRTTVFDQIQNSYSPYPWPEPFDSLGALRNKTQAEWEGRTEELAEALRSGRVVEEYRQANKDGNADIGSLLTGQGVGLIDAIDPVYDIVSHVNTEALESILELSKIAAS